MAACSAWSGYLADCSWFSFHVRPQIQLPVTVDDKKKVVEDVCKERTHAVDAAIVRTMKSRKKLGLSQVLDARPPALRA